VGDSNCRWGAVAIHRGNGRHFGTTPLVVFATLRAIELVRPDWVLALNLALVAAVSLPAFLLALAARKVLAEQAEVGASILHAVRGGCRWAERHCENRRQESLSECHTLLLNGRHTRVFRARNEQTSGHRS